MDIRSLPFSDHFQASDENIVWEHAATSAEGVYQVAIHKGTKLLADLKARVG